MHSLASILSCVAGLADQGSRNKITVGLTEYSLDQLQSTRQGHRRNPSI